MNLSYHLHPLVICRTAALCYAELQGKNIKELLKDPYFRSALFLASKPLYHELAKKNFHYPALPQKLVFTLEKYANRLANRTTPFGAFAGFSFTALTDQQQQVTIHPGPFRLHIQPDFRDVLALFQTQKNKAQHHSRIQANNSLYPTPTAIRYVHYQEAANGKRSFSIHQLEKNALVSRLVRFCRTARSQAQLLTFMTDTLQFEEGDAGELLNELLMLQILEYTFQPNITGEDFNDRLTRHLSPDECLPGSEALSREQFYQLPGLHGQNAASGPGGPRYYANLELNATGGLPVRVSKQLDDALFALRKLSTAGDPPALTAFARSFTARFGERAIPLMTALDPETGISYNDLAYSEQTDLLLKGLDFSPARSALTDIRWGALHQLLLNKWRGDHPEGIVLTEADIQNLPENGLRLPPSFSLPFRVLGNRLLVEAGGGTSALSLVGRFTPFNTVLLESTRSIAATEEEHNKQVIFAEIACITDSHSDNINRRAQLRSYEIPVRTGSLATGDGQISLADLYLSVADNRVLLWSTKLAKRIIPRMSTAYNFQRSDLPIFRFLCDLQYQGLQHSWGIDPGQLFPGLAHYPRISYQDCILSLATWRLSPRKFLPGPTAGLTAQYQAFNKQAADLRLPRYFALTQHDQQLTFDAEDPDSIRLFFEEIRNLDEILIKEVLREPLRGGTVVNMQGDTFASQFIAAVVSDEPAYGEHFEKPSLKTRTQPQRTFIPGSEWLYYKVYCLPVNSDAVLRSVGRAILMLRRQNSLSQWFFIRYLDPEPHLRIRLLVGPDFTADVMRVLKNLFEGLKRQGKVQAILIDTYERETERYAAAPIPRAEEAFYYSSLLVLRWITKIDGTRPAYMLALKITYDTTLLFIPSPEERLRFIKNIRDNLYAENKDAKDLKSGLEQKKRELKSDTYQLMQNKHFYRSNHLDSIAQKYFDVMKAILDRHTVPPLKLLADLNHMHINRVFLGNMRRQELVIYTLLYQHELTAQKQRR